MLEGKTHFGTWLANIALHLQFNWMIQVKFITGSPDLVSIVFLLGFFTQNTLFSRRKNCPFKQLLDYNGWKGRKELKTHCHHQMQLGDEQMKLPLDLLGNLADTLVSSNFCQICSFDHASCAAETFKNRRCRWLWGGEQEGGTCFSG